MRPRSAPRVRFGKACGHLARDSRGIAMVEFALLLPILLTLVLVTAEVVNAIDQKRKVVQLSRTIADLTAQGDTQSPMSASLMTDIFASAAPILAPFAAANAAIQVSAIGVYQAGSQISVRVCSTYPSTSTRSVGLATNIAVPTNFQRAGARFVLAEVTMPYKPILGTVAKRLIQGLSLTFTWSESVIWPVRNGTSYLADAEVVLPGGASCPA